MPLVLWLVISAAPAAQVKFAAPGFTGGNVPADVVSVASEHFAQQLALQGFRVVTGSEIAAALGVERQRQLVGCTDEGSSCLAELSSALGVDGIVTGSLGRFGTRYTVNVKVVRSSDARQLAVFSSTVESEGALPEALARAAREVATGVKVTLGLTQASPLTGISSAPWSYRKRGGLISFIAGIVVATVGGISALASWSMHRALSDPNKPPSVGEAFTLKQNGQQLQDFGILCFAVGGAAIGVGSTLFFMDDSKQPIRASLSVGRDGLGLSVSGVLP